MAALHADRYSLPLRSFKYLSSADQIVLAAILCHQPPPNADRRASSWWQNYAAQTKKDIHALSPRLRAYPNWFSRFANRRSRDSTREKSRSLCPIHESLNRSVVRSTLSWIQREIDVNIPGLLAPLLAAGLLPHNVTQAFTCLQDARAMWLDPGTFENFFGKKVKGKWARQADRCAACVLARLGSDAVALIALEAGMLVRLGKRTHVGNAGGAAPRQSIVGGGRRLHYVECMINQFESAETLHKDAESVAKVVTEAFEGWTNRNSDLVRQAGERVRLSRVASRAGRLSRSATRDGQLKTAGEQQSYSNSLSEGTTVDIYFQDESPPTFNMPDWGNAPTEIKPLARPTVPSTMLHNDEPYMPIAWREKQRQARNRTTDECLMSVISDYRNTVYEPAFGRQDYLGFKQEREEESDGAYDMPHSPTHRLSLKRGPDGNLETVAEGQPAIVESSGSSFSEDFVDRTLKMPPQELDAFSQDQQPGTVQRWKPQPAQQSMHLSQRYWPKAPPELQRYSPDSVYSSSQISPTGSPGHRKRDNAADFGIGNPF